MNPYSEVTHKQEHNIFRAGYTECLLDVFDYIRCNPSVLDSDRIRDLDKMMKDAKVVSMNEPALT